MKGFFKKRKHIVDEIGGRDKEKNITYLNGRIYT